MTTPTVISRLQLARRLAVPGASHRNGSRFLTSRSRERGGRERDRERAIDVLGVKANCSIQLELWTHRIMATRVFVDVARERVVVSLAYEAVDNLTSPDTSIIQDRSAFHLFIV
jgi:hypothetical protein